MNGRDHTKLVIGQGVVFSRLQVVKFHFPLLHKEERDSISSLKIASERKLSGAEVEHLNGPPEGERCSERDNIHVGLAASLVCLSLAVLDQLTDVLNALVGKLHRSGTAAIVEGY